MKNKMNPAEFLGAKVLSTVDNLAIKGGQSHEPKCKDHGDPRYQPCQYQVQQQIQNQF